MGFKNLQEKLKNIYYSFLLQIFRIFDINNDNTVSQKELSRLVKDLFHLFTKKDNPDRDSQEALATKAFQVKFLWINRWIKGQKVPEMVEYGPKSSQNIRFIEKGQNYQILKKWSKVVEIGHKSSEKAKKRQRYQTIPDCDSLSG